MVERRFDAVRQISMTVVPAMPCHLGEPVESFAEIAQFLVRSDAAGIIG
jgi:hypothetical protein